MNRERATFREIPVWLVIEQGGLQTTYYDVEKLPEIVKTEGFAAYQNYPTKWGLLFAGVPTEEEFHDDFEGWDQLYGDRRDELDAAKIHLGDEYAFLTNIPAKYRITHVFKFTDAGPEEWAAYH